MGGVWVPSHGGGVDALSSEQLVWEHPAPTVRDEVTVGPSLQKAFQHIVHRVAPAACACINVDGIWLVEGVFPTDSKRAISAV